MSEVASRPAPSRGRGTSRGRGGFRGTNRPRDRQLNGEHKDSHRDETEQGDIGVMKKKYSSQLSSLKEVFSDWADVDLLFALEETDGDLERTIDHISEGNVAQFSDVKKKTKDRSRSKITKDVASDPNFRAPRRGGTEGARGGRGRPDRGRGARPARGGSHAPTGDRSASYTAVPVPNESSGWESSTATNDGWGDPAAAPAPIKPTKAVVSESEKSSISSPQPPKKTWAMMFAPQPKPAPVRPKPAAETTPTIEAGADPSDISDSYIEVTHADVDGDGAAPTSQPDDAPAAVPIRAIAPDIVVDDSNVDLPPSKDKLTEDNVEHLPDTSNPAPTGTAASTVESSRGPDSTAHSVLAQASQPAPIGRPTMGGFATTAFKATITQGRSTSFQRRILEQQEAVVMPRNHAVDQAAVQFGSLGLNGDSSLDVDEDREDAETRAQPPQHSPVAQPRAALPPAPRQEPAQEPTQPKPAPGLPPAPQKEALQQQPAVTPIGSQPIGQQSQSSQSYSQFSRYGQQNVPQNSIPADVSAAPQKPFDPFSGQQSQQSQFESYPSHSQAPGAQQQSATHLSGFSSAANDYSSYYTADQRNSYQNYYGFGQQSAASQQETPSTQQRNTGGLGATTNDSSYPSNQAQQLQSRYGENQQSGHNTPNPSVPSQQHHGQGQGQPVHQQPHGQGQHANYPYGNHPYYTQPYYTTYMNQYGTGYGQQNFGGPFNSKTAMYGQPHHGYGMPQTTYDQHTTSPAVAGGFGDNSLRGALGSDYARSGSAQPSQNQQHSTTGAFGNPEGFGRTGGFPSQNQQYGQQSTQQSQGEVDSNSLKPFGGAAADKSASSVTGAPGPSAPGSSLGTHQGGAPGRPTSATNVSATSGNQSAQSGSGLPPPQSHQGFGGYPSHLGQGASGYGGALGGLGGHQGAGGAQSHQAGGGAGYGGYGGPGFGNSYGQQNYGRGWGGGGGGGNYTQH